MSIIVKISKLLKLIDIAQKKWSEKDEVIK